MRTSVYTFLLLTALLLTPCAVYAGTDDSGLQVFTVDFSKQLGESADVAQEDTLLSPYCYNMFSSGNGLVSFPEDEGATSQNWSGNAFDCSTIGVYNFVRLINGSAADLVLHIYPGYPSSGGSADDKQIILATGLTTVYGSDLFAYSGGDTASVFVGNKIINVSGSPSAPTTSETALPGGLSFRSATIWQNRLFLATENYLYYSAAQNYSDFSNTATTGGTTRIFSTITIQKIIGTKYGLYIFCNDGIYIQTGIGKNGWIIEKISNKTLASIQCISQYEDQIFFLESTTKRCAKLWSVSGTNIQQIATLPQEISSDNSLKIISGGDFIVFSTPTVNGTSFLYNTKTQTFSRSSNYNGLGNTYFYIKKISDTKYQLYYLPRLKKFNLYNSGPKGGALTPMSPWAYQTSWLTLDGNSGNRKEIDRIEFDYQGGTTAVYLYYAYGNGSSAYSSTTLTAPVNTRLSTYTWNAPIGKQQSNRFYLYFLSSGAQTMATNYILKQARIYYRNIGNYKTNSLR